MEKIYTSILIAFVISLVLSPIFIPLLRKLKFGQQIRDQGPKSHYQKSGTPTMGGVIFLLSALISLLIIAPLNGEILILLFVTLATGLIGFMDDFQKVVKKRSLGLKGRYKIFGQLLVVAVFSIYLNSIDHSTELLIPFTNFEIDLGFSYYLFLALMILGTSNAVNITDGLDGLATGVVVICLTSFVILAHMHNLTGTALFGSAFIGACAGFLIFNLHPAKVFMGDVGSLALGSGLASMAVLTKAELALVIIGLTLVIETLSVIGQVIFYQTTGNRILLMSPLHHHFELKGWSEWKVVLVFWVFTLITAAIGIISVINL
ncbi:phospho-N-acetylmuramoyl-pentapeptide-transferase [Natranaerobius thermophilus]|uniref:Phospho-N-acetylmuramoyl-pentapeptide-transferase n=1 Tax=Natranaerobius thermophilus (strain ATCC BAA-1301 / DSM 18059 / JW/NM-WN-LF) TaxID=457570 RepID=B2A2G9_NATTJ|nr:phospho-N-acetylmuramoyl-pentapeptide-transferase [Natranaerobius thermophilus]ACB84884.1 Phospho-N-acetylmuramoyl-pentapeptide-transferase [Natranaerobius thermophilus JW/NM-WN-LF]